MRQENGFNAVENKLAHLNEGLKKQLTHKLANQLLVIVKKNAADAHFLQGLKNPEDIFKYVEIIETSDSEILITLHVNKNSRKSYAKTGKATSRQAKTLLRLGYRYREPGHYVTKSMAWIMANRSEAQAGAIIHSMQEKQGINPADARKRDFIVVNRKKLLGAFFDRQLPNINAFLTDEIHKLT